MNKLISKHPKLLGSSVDPTKLSLTVKGILLCVVGIITPLLIGWGYDVAQMDLNGLVDLIVNAVQAVAIAVSAVMTVWGAVRKIYVNFKK
jgi:hypothetical protein